MKNKIKLFVIMIILIITGCSKVILEPENPNGGKSRDTTQSEIIIIG